MTHKIALTFEDGVTRFIDCGSDEVVADAAYRLGVNIPLDCRDGACGTCKALCESGRYHMGDYIEDALSVEEAATGYVLACQMRPDSDCVVRINAASTACKLRESSSEAEIVKVEKLSPTTIAFAVRLENPDAFAFLPGQYVKLTVPGSAQSRAYSFSSPVGAAEASFLVRDVPNGLMSSYLRERAKPGDLIQLKGPLGSFYLRDIKRPVLMLAGGTGLAPFLAMLGTIAVTGSDQPIHLIYGVTRDMDLVAVEALEAYARELPNFTFTICVADEGSAFPLKGYVTKYISEKHLNEGDVDVYLCGPPPMVDAVRNHLRDRNITPANFHFERFSASGEAGNQATGAAA
ncbi:MAG TPA: benzoate 1,2-dioxygenase electron transfer component BenC [Dongiaceae bacterium]|nr:benzoate 1,2-dioxygenase electron transfer component BenC [Dongiaceae bacterium]